MVRLRRCRPAVRGPRRAAENHSRKTLDRTPAKARNRDRYRSFNKLTAVVDGQRRIVADPPLIVPIADFSAAYADQNEND